MFLREFDNPECKRFIFDARQAKIFDDIGKFSEEKKDKVHAPFLFFYMEFTEPVLFNTQEPGSKDFCRGLIYHEAQMDATEALDEKETREIKVSRLTFFSESDKGEKVDRTWSITPEGYPLAGVPPHWMSVKEQKRGRDESSFHPIDSEALPDWAKKYDILLDMRKLLKFRWWEENCIAYTELFYWVCAFCMAKSVQIVPVPMIRQERRALERQGKVPNPWHIVKVEPKIKSAIQSAGGGSSPAYQFDVIGHLRFNKHRRRDGTFIDSIEWVDSHRRGLKNELYIPKTYQVKAGAKPSELMKKYWNK